MLGPQFACAPRNWKAAWRIGRSMLRPYKFRSGIANCRTEASGCSPQAAEINVRGIFEADAAILVVGVEDAPEFSHHRREIRRVWRGNKRTAAQASGEAFEIELLEIGKLGGAILVWTEEFAHMHFRRIVLLDALIVRAEVSKQVFVFADERACLDKPLVPHDDEPAVGFEDALKFTAGSIAIEPVESLARGHKIHGGRLERGGLRRAVHAGEPIVRSKIFLARFAHGLIGLDAENAISVSQEEFAQKARAGANVRDNVAVAQATFGAQEIANARGIAGTVADVVGDAVGEALCGIGEGHDFETRDL